MFSKKNKKIRENDMVLSFCRSLDCVTEEKADSLICSCNQALVVSQAL